jgi:hypothetical protein
MPAGDFMSRILRLKNVMPGSTWVQQQKQSSSSDSWLKGRSRREISEAEIVTMGLLVSVTGATPAAVAILLADRPVNSSLQN